LEGQFLIFFDVIVKDQCERFEVERVAAELRDLSRFLQSSFELSSRKDQLVGLIRESLGESLWSSCFSGLDSWSDETKFQALEVLVAIIHPENEVSVAFSGFPTRSR